jgi:hypothetical protein
MAAVRVSLFALVATLASVARATTSCMNSIEAFRTSHSPCPRLCDNMNDCCCLAQKAQCLLAGFDQMIAAGVCTSTDRDQRMQDVYGQCLGATCMTGSIDAVCHFVSPNGQSACPLLPMTGGGGDGNVSTSGPDGGGKAAAVVILALLYAAVVAGLSVYFKRHAEVQASTEGQATGYEHLSGYPETRG